jgi:hypothetical protein
MTDLAKKNAVLVHALSSAMRSTGNGLGTVPGLLKRVIVEESWKEFTTPLGHPVKHGRFVDFITAPSPEGLGADVGLVTRICAPDEEAADLLDQALAGKQGERTDLVSNRNEVGRPVGTSKAAALRRLRKDKPELHADVLAGRLSAHAAMVQAGFRPKTVSVPVSQPDSIAAALRRHLSPDDIARLIKLLLEEP